MSPSRTRKPVAHGRPRSEVIVAVAVSTGIVVATVLLIWLLRPGTSGVDGTGGVMTRQPRASLLIVLAVLVAIGVVVWLIRGQRRPTRVQSRVTIPIAVTVIVIGSIVIGVVWPGGLVRHYASAPKPPKPAKTTTTTISTGTTTAKGTTGGK